MNSRNKLIIMVGVCAMALVGCAGALGKTNSTDPTERGLSYVAAAIVTNAVLRAIFNK